MKMEKKKLAIMGVIFLVLAMSMSFVNAEFWACFNKGDIIDYCNPKTNDRICGSNSGCEYCMASYNEDKGCFNQGNWNLCNTIIKNCSTGFQQNIDGEAPNLIINNPVQGEIYSSRSILIDFDLDERASVYYYDNIRGRGRWKKICSKCSPGSPAYSRKRSFKDGFNDLTFKAIDVVGNEIYINRSFFIDSKKPRIYKTFPRKKYADGLFEIQYTESNLDSIDLVYGNYYMGYETERLENCSSGVKEWCDVRIDLSEYDGQDIDYHFIVRDIAGNIRESKKRNLKVDTTFPVLNNPDDFWEHALGERYVYFKFNITEENFDEVNYMDNEDRRPRWRRLCSRLKKGICEKKKSFRKGHHNLDIQIIDDAGNSIGYNIEFDVE